MIILDTSILRSFGPESSSVDLLRTIKAVGSERIAVPWMVQEELAAQRAIKYQELHERAAQALEALRRATPWGLDVELGDCDTEQVREHWRRTWGFLDDVIPTSDEAIRQALFREANLLPPCKESKNQSKNQKTGSRDAAIWLSAVEYAEENPDETVYFVSANTKDFGDGTSFPYPMNEDIAYMRDRFVLLTSMDAVASHFTETTKTDEALVTEILRSDTVLSDLADKGKVLFRYSLDPAFQCAILLPDGRSVITQAALWRTLNASLGSVENIRTFRIGDREWCTASVEWHITGHIERALFGAGPAYGAVSWTTAVLFNLNRENPNLTVLREAPPRPASDDALGTLGLPSVDETTIKQAVAIFQQASNVAADGARPWRATRWGVPYGDLVRQSRLRMGETSSG